MADNINIDGGSTLTVATDDISGVHYQIVKVAHGAANAATQSSDTAPFPVTVASITIGTVTITPTTTASTINNAAGNPVNVTGNVNVATATLGTVTITGTVTPTTTASTITNAAGNPVNVALTSTAVTVSNATSINVNVATATLGTVAITGAVSLSNTSVTVNNGTSINVNVASATLGTLTITGTTVVTSGNINVSSATLGTVNITGSVTNSVSTIQIISRTLTGSSGSLTATNGTISATPTNKIKVYAFSLTTTCPTEVIAVFNSGGVANGLELWRDTLMAPAGASAGANIAVTPPAFLFASRTGTAVSLSLSTAVLVHWSISYFEEA